MKPSIVFQAVFLSIFLVCALSNAGRVCLLGNKKGSGGKMQWVSDHELEECDVILPGGYSEKLSPKKFKIWPDEIKFSKPSAEEVKVSRPINVTDGDQSTSKEARVTKTMSSSSAKDSIRISTSKVATTSLPVKPTTATTPCQYWTGYGLFEYCLSDVSLSWHDAEKNCQSNPNRGRLVVLDSEGKKNNVSDFRHKGNFGVDWVWIGVNDLDVEGTWKFVNSKPVLESFWNDGEPNGNTGSRGDQDCAFSDSRDKWRDYECDNQLQFACERMRTDLN